MKYDQMLMRGRRCVLLALFIVVFFVLVTPTAFVRYINELLTGLSIKQYVKGIFNTFLPTLLLLIYQQVVLYHSIIFIVKQEKRTSVSMEVASRLTKYLIFMSIYVFILQAMGLQTIVQVTVDGWDKWRILLPTKITETGLFFVIFIIHQAFIQGGIALLQPAKIIVSRIKLNLAKTPLEEMRALEAGPFDFAFEFAVTLNTFLIIISYAVSYPLILIIGLIYFSTRHMIHKYLLLCVFYIDKESTGSSIPKTCLHSILTYIFIYQLLTGLIFTVNEDYTIQIIGGCLILISLVIFLVLQFKLPAIMKLVTKLLKKFSKIDDKENESLNHTEVLYMHPIDKKTRDISQAEVCLIDALAANNPDVKDQ